MARTKSTARRSTGGPPPRKQLAAQAQRLSVHSAWTKNYESVALKVGSAKYFIKRALRHRLFIAHHKQSNIGTPKIGIDLEWIGWPRHQHLLEMPSMEKSFDDPLAAMIMVLKNYIEQKNQNKVKSIRCSACIGYGHAPFKWCADPGCVLAICHDCFNRFCTSVVNKSSPITNGVHYLDRDWRCTDFVGYKTSVQQHDHSLVPRPIVYHFLSYFPGENNNQQLVRTAFYNNFSNENVQSFYGTVVTYYPPAGRRCGSMQSLRDEINEKLATDIHIDLDFISITISCHSDARGNFMIGNEIVDFTSFMTELKNSLIVFRTRTANGLFPYTPILIILLSCQVDPSTAATLLQDFPEEVYFLIFNNPTAFVVTVPAVVSMLQLMKDERYEPLSALQDGFSSAALNESLPYLFCVNCVAVVQQYPVSSNNNNNNNIDDDDDNNNNNNNNINNNDNTDQQKNSGASKRSKKKQRNRKNQKIKKAAALRLAADKANNNQNSLSNQDEDDDVVILVNDNYKS